MEDTLGDLKRLVTSLLVMSLNPCSNGRYSRRTFIEGERNVVFMS